MHTIVMVSKEATTNSIVQGVDTSTQTDQMSLYSEAHVNQLTEEIAECHTAIQRITMERDDALASDARTYRRLWKACKSTVKQEEV